MHGTGGELKLADAPGPSSTEGTGLEAEFAPSTTGTTSTNSSAVNVVERYPVTGSTDFWGISFGFSSTDQGAMSGEALCLLLRRRC